MSVHVQREVLNATTAIFTIKGSRSSIDALATALIRIKDIIVFTQEQEIRELNNFIEQQFLRNVELIERVGLETEGLKIPALKPIENNFLTIFCEIGSSLDTFLINKPSK